MFAALIKTWWVIFLGCAAITIILFIGPAILAIVAAVCTFIIAPLLILVAVLGNWNQENGQ